MFEIECDPPPGAFVDGFQFFRDQNDAIVGRCVWCRVGFPVTLESAANPGT